MSHQSDPVLLERLDYYQDRALRFWMPNAARIPQGPDSQAVNKLASLLEQHNSDPWLREFLVSLNRDTTAAVQALSNAIRANRDGLYGAAVEQSQIASRIFAQQRNLPGVLRAKFESIYASQRFLVGFDCLSQIAATQAPERYRWLNIQLDLEKYTCSNFGGEFTAIQQGLEKARNTAETAHYHLLTLRSIALAAGIKRQQQSGCREVWEEVAQGLNFYWRDAPYDPWPLYQLYSILEQCAAQVKLWHAAEALQRHSISLLATANQDADPDLILEGSARAELAAILTTEYRDAEAHAEQEAADSLWTKAGNEKTADTYRLFMRVRLAEIQLNHDDPQRAWSMLSSARELLSSTQYHLLALDFYRVLGETCRRLHRPSDAVLAYANGISLAENSLQSIHGNTKERMQWLGKIDAVYRGMTRIWLEQGRTADAWKLWEWFRTRSLFPDSALPRDHSLLGTSEDIVEAEISRISFPSEKHLVYASFVDGVEAWTVDRAGVKAHWIPIKQSNLSSLVNDFAMECATQSSPLQAVQTQGRNLYELLVQPAASDLPQSGIVVVELDKILSPLVLPALVEPDGRYLAESLFFVYSPGVLMEKSLRPPQPPEETDRLLLVDASEPNGPAAVPGHLEEQQAALLTYHRARLITGPQATPAEIRRELSKINIFDFIGHGEQHDWRTGLRLSSTAFLTSDDFPPQNLGRLKLSILAACSTGSSGDDRLLDAGNLVHSFLVAGVPDVVASQWNVDSTATSLLMRNFYARLHEGKTVPQAMFEAQKEALAARSHPYFWAGFNLFGKAH